MTPHDLLLADQARILRQAAELLDEVDDDLYGRPAEEVGLASCGSHLRHVLDVYGCFLRGLAEGRVDYEDRRRENRVERDRAHARRRLEETVAALEGLEAPEEDGALAVRSDCVGADGEERPWARSTVERELLFLLHHTVHHYALIAAVLRAHGRDPRPDLGFAPSTLRHLERTQPCAR